MNRRPKLAQGVKLPAGQIQPALVQVLVPPKWELGTLHLQQLVRRIEIDYLDFCDVAKRAIDEQWWAHYGYAGPQPYFEDKVGIGYRSVRRRLVIAEALERLPEADRGSAREALAGIGGHKASVLAPLLGQVPDWRDFVELAKDATEEAVQDAVSRRLGHKPRGVAGEPGDRFLRWILNSVPPDERSFVENTFAALRQHFDVQNAVSGFLVMVAMTAQELAAHGILVDPTKGGAHVARRDQTAGREPGAAEPVGRDLAGPTESSAGQARVPGDGGSPDGGESEKAEA